VLDFRSAGYLGIQHASEDLGRWQHLTTGVPAAVCEQEPTAAVAAALARLQGTETAILARSTLHAFVDCCAVLADRGGILIDSAAYPVARWAAEAAGGRGVPVEEYDHLDPDDLRRKLRAARWRQGHPVVITDGQCAGCGRPTPLDALAATTHEAGGTLLIDDTQSLGILGRWPTAADPWGVGGGGSLRFNEIAGPGVAAVSSLAKAFGAPLTVLAGPTAIIDRLQSDGPCRAHTSPPTMADLSAAAQALVINRRNGDERRRRLVDLIRHLRRTLLSQGLEPDGGCSPIQQLELSCANPQRVLAYLRERDILALLTSAECRPPTALTLVLTAGHRLADVDRLADVLSEIRCHLLAPPGRPTGRLAHAGLGSIA
jgi:8-amino-7-oxononanoate synthase